MKPSYEKIPTQLNTSFHIHRAVNKYSNIPWHFHPEMELTYIHKGKGTKYIGNSISHFQPGEIVLLGPNIPHLWKNDSDFYHDKSHLTHEDWVIQFDKSFWGETFLHLPEMNKIKGLLDNATRGIVIRFDQAKSENFKTLFDRIFFAESFVKLQLFIEMLGLIAYYGQNSYLNTEVLNEANPRDSERMKRVYTFITNNYLKEIKLKDAASLIGLSVTGFCRYFKKLNNKSFIEYVNEVRIGHACKKLQEKEVSITEVCYDSGFNNFSNFSRQFKKITGMNPNQYRKNYNFEYTDN